MHDRYQQANFQNQPPVWQQPHYSQSKPPYFKYDEEVYDETKYILDLIGELELRFKLAEKAKVFFPHGVTHHYYYQAIDDNGDEGWTIEGLNDYFDTEKDVIKLIEEIGPILKWQEAYLLYKG